MAEINKINVNGTNYDIITTDSELPVLGLYGYDNCGPVLTYPENFSGAEISNIIPSLGVMRIATGYGYKYKIFVLFDPESEDLEWKTIDN